MREISPTEMKRRNENGQNKMKKALRKAIRSAADEGYNNVNFNPKEFACSETIKEWLTGLGFEIVPCCSTRIEIRW